jgi:hypothetical protein
MNYAEVCAIAKSHHVKPGKLPKTELIRTIQACEGNFDCFATASNGECDQNGCIWREDCFVAAQQGE